MLLAQSRAGKVSSLHEGDNVHDNLVLIQNGVDDNGHERGKVGFAANLDDDDDQTTSLENGTIKGISACLLLTGR